MFLKLNRDGKIKVHEVAGGNKQRVFIIKEELSSPTVSTAAVLLSYVIDAHEHWDVANIDILNAFIQTSVKKIEDMATIIVQETLVNVLVEIAPDIYGPYIRTDKKGVKTLNLRCRNAIYGTMVASLLYCNKIYNMIKHLGFKINPYDPCIGNWMIDDNHKPICWNVDDFNIKHVDPKVNNKLIKSLKQ